MTAAGRPGWFQRLLLPGLAFKAVVIGGGYATGREMAEFFLPAGAWGGLAGMALATILFSVLAILTFLFARGVAAYDYRSFFRELLGSGWIAFEGVYIAFVVLILAVYGAAAGAIGTALTGAPPVVGTLLLMAAIGATVARGNRSVERVFEYVSYLLYAVYAAFVVLAFWQFGDRISAALATGVFGESWAIGGATYVSYNIIAAVVILPVLRHLASTRDAVVAGALCGPLTMLPAVLFFLPMIAFQTEIVGATLPSDYLLVRIGLPAFQLVFQLMIFAALLESGAGSVHAINERIDHAWRARYGASLGRGARVAIALTLLIGCMLLAGRFGLVALIASGYRLLGVALVLVFVLPLLTIGVARLRRSQPTGVPHEP